MKSKVNIDIRMRELPQQMIAVPNEQSENFEKYPFERNVNDKCVIEFYQKSFNRIEECLIKQDYPEKCYEKSIASNELEIEAVNLAVLQQMKSVEIATANDYICRDSRNIAYRNTSSLMSLRTECSKK